MAKKTSDKREIPTLEQTNPAQKYKRFLVLGTVLTNRLATAEVGDAIGVVYKGLNDNGGIQPYEDYNVKVQKNVTKDRLTMVELLSLTADDITLKGTQPLMGIIVEVADFTTTFGPTRSITVSTDLDDIHPAEPEPF